MNHQAHFNFAHSTGKRTTVFFRDFIFKCNQNMGQLTNVYPVCEYASIQCVNGRKC